MPVTYDRIATTTLGSSTTNIVFSGISSSYTDLRLVLAGGGDSSGSRVWLRINNDTTNFFGNLWAGAYLAGPYAGGTWDQVGTMLSNIIGTGNSDTRFGLLTCDIMNYTTTQGKVGIRKYSMNKDFISSGPEYGIASWNSGSTITRLDIYLSAGSWLPGTQCTLYGILRA